MRGRLGSAPLAELARRAPARGRIADVGCGHGVLCALLAEGSPGREVLGVDPDPRKIAWARASAGQLPNVRFEIGTEASLSPASFDAVVVADVLYLLPLDAWPSFLSELHRALVPGGTLLLKEAENDGSWRYAKCLAQEQLMVRVFRRTRASGGLGFASRAYLSELLKKAGFSVDEVASLAKGYTTPHVLFVGRSV